MSKTISEIIDEQIANNPILSDEEFKELTAPINESELFDGERLSEEFAYIEGMYAKCSTEMERDRVSIIIKEELTRRRNLNGLKPKGQFTKIHK